MIAAALTQNIGINNGQVEWGLSFYLHRGLFHQSYWMAVLGQMLQDLENYIFFIILYIYIYM